MAKRGAERAKGKGQKAIALFMGVCDECVLCVEIFRANKSHTNKNKQTGKRTNNKPAGKQTNKRGSQASERGKHTTVEIGNSRMLLLATVDGQDHRDQKPPLYHKTGPEPRPKTRHATDQ